MNFHHHTLCDTANLKGIRTFVENSLKTLCTDQGEVELMVLAVDEVCANLILHSNKNNNEPLEVIITPKKDGIMFDIRDRGIFFNYESYDPPLVEDLQKQERRGGLGMLMVRKIMDNIHYEHQPAFNSCKLFKRLASSPI